MTEQTPPLNLWDKRDDESDVAYQAFEEYLSMPIPRSLRDVAQKLDKSLTLIGRWSSKHNWVERIASWDAVQRAQIASQRAELREQLLIDELTDAKRLLKKWNRLFDEADILKQHTEFVGNTPTVFVEVNVDGYMALAKLRREIGDQGRRALGMPLQVTGQEITGKDGGPVEFVHYIEWTDDDDNSGHS